MINCLKSIVFLSILSFLLFSTPLQALSPEDLFKTNEDLKRECNALDEVIPSALAFQKGYATFFL